jgi:hypothetical protein
MSLQSVTKVEVKTAWRDPARQVSPGSNIPGGLARVSNYFNICLKFP